MLSRSVHDPKVKMNDSQEGEMESDGAVIRCGRTSRPVEAALPSLLLHSAQTGRCLFLYEICCIKLTRCIPTMNNKRSKNRRISRTNRDHFGR